MTTKFSIRSTDWADKTSVGDFGGFEKEAATKYNEMLVMLADKITADDSESWADATHALWDLVGSDEELPRYSESEMLKAVEKVA